MSGFYTEDLDRVLDKVEIVYPETVSKDGSFVSYYLPHYYNIDSAERPRRGQEFPGGLAKDAIHFFIPIGGEKQHLELFPNKNFISPRLVVERRDARDVENVNKAKISQVSQRQCHYSGQIVGKGNSSAALSTCYGLAGYIRMPAGDEYFIEPVKNSKPAHDKEHPHIIYKRSGMKDGHGSSNCLTKGRAKEAFEDRMQWEALYGDQVRREMSGASTNEIVQGSNKGASSLTSFESLRSPSSVSKDHSQTIEKLNNRNSFDEDKPMNLNDPQISDNQYRSNIQRVHHFQRMADEQADNNTANDNIHSSIKNAGSLKKVESNIEDDKQGQWDYMGKQDDLGSLEHNRFKRELNYNHDNLDIEQKQSMDKVDDEHISKTVKSHGHLSETKHKLAKNIKQRSIKPINTNVALKNQTEQIVKRAGEVNQQTNISNDKIGNNENIALFRDQSGLDELKNFTNPKNKRENREKAHMSVDDNTGFNQIINQDNQKEIKAQKNQIVPNSSDTLIKMPNKPKENSIHLSNNENNIKREIHLDTSDKSWQPNEKSDKLKLVHKKGDTTKIIPEEHGNLLEENTGSQTQLANSLENDNDKESNLNLIKANKGSIINDENIASDVETEADDIHKIKVKKDTNDILSIAGSEKKFKQQDQSYPNYLEHIDGQYQKHNKILSNPNNTQDRYIKITDNNQEISELGRQSNENLLNNTREIAGQAVQDIPRKSDNNIDEIVIRIKAPDGTINDVKRTFKSDEIVKKDSSLFINAADDNNDKTFSVQNNEVNKKTAIRDKNTRESDKSDFSSSRFSNNNNDKLCSQKTSDVEKQQHTGKEDSDYNKSKNKREDTIHLIIETEPEINHAYNSEANVPRPNLFCQGKNCLEINPVVLNETNTAAVAPVLNVQPANNNVTIGKTKLVEKRDVEDADNKPFEECDAETTTVKPLLCFDLLSKQFNLELMITVDYKVVKMHDDDDIENFVLTIVNMVSTNFYDKSIGINLSVVLIRLILLTTCIKELDSDQFNPDELLENFCTWQVLINPGKDDHPHHHDMAVFVTRMDKCEGQVMGVSYMTSVCRPDKACIVCIDEGLLLANTITHQIGHSFGAEHDDGQGSGCSSTAPDGTPYHMAPTISETSYSWSVCSRDAIVQFLRTQGSWCLTDQVEERTFNFPLMLPGQIYSAAQQCKLNYHMTALPCAIGSFCERLYCQVTEKLCATKGDPPADGTFCAADMWCFHRECVHIGRRPGSVNGEWGPWTEWSTCTRSCGGGVSSSYRICNNPKPSHGGRFCIGDRIRHKMCATKPCQGFTESFRDLQCKKTEDRPFRGKLSNWIQYQSLFTNIECSLVCQNRRGDIVMRSPIVADGTPCKAGTRNVCIQGMCRNVGCDWVIDSFAKEDACGMCHGNSTECKIVQGVFDEPTNQRGMVEFLRVPKNAGMVFVREASPSINVLAVSGAINKVFYLNGLGREDSMPGDVAFGLTHGVYEVRSAMERIFIRGPTTEELLFYVAFKEPNKGIHYQYAVPDFDPTYIPRYLWQYLDWDPCTDPCSGGSQKAQAKCVEDKGGVVDDIFCTQSTKPRDIIRPCNEFPCQAKWWVSVWSDCICTGQTNVMFRSVLCMRATDESATRSEIVKESECVGHKKPATQKPCNVTDEDEESCYIKRSVQGDDMFRSHQDMRKAINPKRAYFIMSPASLIPESRQQETEMLSTHIKDVSKEREKRNNKDQKKSIKPKDKMYAKESGTKIKSKQSDKEADQFSNKKKTTSVKIKENNNQIFSELPKNNEDKYQDRIENTPFVVDKLRKQLARLKSYGEKASKVNDTDISKGEDDSDPDTSDAQDPPSETKQSGLGDEEETSTTGDSSICENSTTDSAICKHTIEMVPHDRTTCCKTTLRYNKHSKPAETTTLRPVSMEVDDLDMNHFILTVVPVDPKNRKMLPQSDSEFMNFGSVGDLSVVDESNGTILSGQQAIDFLKFARKNVTEVPDIHINDIY